MRSGCTCRVKLKPNMKQHNTSSISPSFHLSISPSRTHEKRANNKLIFNLNGKQFCWGKLWLSHTKWIIYTSQYTSSCSRNQFSEILNADGERKAVPLLRAYVIAFVQVSLFSSLKIENPSNRCNYAMSEKKQQTSGGKNTKSRKTNIELITRDVFGNAIRFNSLNLTWCAFIGQFINYSSTHFKVCANSLMFGQW